MSAVGSGSDGRPGRGPKPPSSLRADSSRADSRPNSGEDTYQYRQLRAEPERGNVRRAHPRPGARKYGRRARTGDRGLPRRGADVPAARGVQGARARGRHVPLRGGRRGLPGVLGPPGRRAARRGRTTGTRSASGSCRSRSGSSAGSSTSSYNCLDRHVEAGRGDKVAFHWEGEPGDTRTITYAELLAEVQRFANVLKGLGVQQGRPGRHLHADDPRAAGRACSPAPASARPHSVVFGGFSADSLADRINDAEAKVLITADGGWRRGAAVPAQAQRRRRARRHADHRARRGRAARPSNDVAHGATGRDHWYHELMADGGGRLPGRADGQRAAALPALHLGHHRASPRGSCTRPAATSPRSRSPTSTCSTSIPTTDVYWCAADIGWVTGHSYIVYGPLANGATSVMYEGTPDTPGQGPVVGRSSRSTGSRSSTPRRPPSARS